MLWAILSISDKLLKVDAYMSYCWFFEWILVYHNGSKLILCRSYLPKPVRIGSNNLNVALICVNLSQFVCLGEGSSGTKDKGKSPS